MALEHRAYPPELAADVNVAEQQDGDRPAFVVGSASTGRYILVHEAERRVLELIAEQRTVGAICEEFSRRHGQALPRLVLMRFLTKLDDLGILAGTHVDGAATSDQALGPLFYVRLKLFDPDALFARMIPHLRWVWTAPFVALTTLLTIGALLLTLTNWPEVANYGLHTLRAHYVAVFVAGTLVVFTHEFAHGLTCKAFGGRSTEVGVLMIYYVLPALYCNVSGLHSIPQRSRRLWVIAAGIYWQVLVGVVALICWFAVTPYTLVSDAAFIVFLGSVMDVVFNANPLIKLDGYYFLSQWLRLPNLMDRSRAYCGALLRRLLFGERDATAARYPTRERVIYSAFGLLSFAYTVGLRVVIVWVAGDYLMDWFHLPGLLMTAALALLYMRQPVRHAASSATRLVAALFAFLKQVRKDDMATDHHAPSVPAREHGNGNTKHADSGGSRHASGWRRRFVPAAAALLAATVLLMPWTASVGNYGTLVAVPGQEAIVRAPENGTLTELHAGPGDPVARGAVLGRMSNLDLDEQAIQVQSELTRARADYTRLQGELRAQTESIARVELQYQQRVRDFNDLEIERRQIERHEEANTRTRGMSSEPRAALRTVSTDGTPPTVTTPYPAALAVLQSDIDARGTQLQEANRAHERARALFTAGLVARSELDATLTRAATLSTEWVGARERLEAALVEHQRKHTRTSTELDLARADLGLERLQVQRLHDELQAVRRVVDTLEARSDLLRRKQSGLELVSPRPGVVFGENLPRLTGHYFQKGTEVLRVADTRHLLLRVQLPERQVGDVEVGNPVRLKARAFPDDVFRGVVSKIGGESEPDQNGQATYRVELIVENPNLRLRPGMTAFARIAFGRYALGRILFHKVKQTLRPELWML